MRTKVVDARYVAGAVISMLPPSAYKNAVLRRVLGWDIHPLARVGPCIVLGVKKMSLAAGARLGAFSVYRDLESVVVGADSKIGHWNYVTAARELRTTALDSISTGRPATFQVDGNAVVTSRHYIDCSGGVHIGEFTVMAGVRSTILTHQIDTVRCEQSVAAVSIGRYCIVGSNAMFVPGATVPDRSYVAMGSLVRGDLKAPDMLYAGVPARAVRQIGNEPFFRRSSRRAHVP